MAHAQASALTEDASIVPHSSLLQHAKMCIRAANRC